MLREAANTFFQHPKRNLFIIKLWGLDNSTSFIHKKTGIMIGDGRFELIFTLGEGYRTIRKQKTAFFGEGIYLGGQLDQPMDLEVLPNTVLIFIKLAPWAVGLLSGFHLKFALNETVPFRELNESLYQQLMAYYPLLEMQNILFLLSNAIDEAIQQQRDWGIIQQCCSILDNTYVDYKTAKDHYLKEAKVSSRTIETRFSRYIGLSPQKYANGIRLRRISEELQHGQKADSYTSLALKHGFYDQAHFIRHFKNYWGSLPKHHLVTPTFITNSSEYFRYYTI